MQVCYGIWQVHLLCHCVVVAQKVPEFGFCNIFLNSESFCVKYLCTDSSVLYLSNKIIVLTKCENVLELRSNYEKLCHRGLLTVFPTWMIINLGTQSLFSDIASVHDLDQVIRSSRCQSLEKRQLSRLACHLRSSIDRLRLRSTVERIAGRLIRRTKDMCTRSGDEFRNETFLGLFPFVYRPSVGS